MASIQPTAIKHNAGVAVNIPNLSSQLFDFITLVVTKIINKMAANTQNTRIKIPYPNELLGFCLPAWNNKSVIA